MTSTQKRAAQYDKSSPRNISINLTINISLSPDGDVDVSVDDVKKIGTAKFESTAHGSSSLETIIGPDDDRSEVHTITDNDTQESARAVCGIIKSSDIEETEAGTGLYHISAQSLNELIKSERGLPLCRDERFREQPTAALYGTAFLIDDDKVATARHCVDHGVIEDVKFVFYYEVSSQGRHPDFFRHDDIYEGTQILAKSDFTDFGEDWAIVQLDRPVRGITPLRLRKGGKVPDDKSVYVIGHPKGLPKKFADGAEVFDNIHDPYFTATLDTYKGNSGSPVFNAETHMVEGILIGGNKDFEYDPSNDCYRSKVIDPGDGRMEVVTRIKYVEAAFEDLDNTA